jgi:hypothetical protein
MSRSVAEWIGKTDDTPVPPRRTCAVDGCGKRVDSHDFGVSQTAISKIAKGKIWGWLK